VERAVSERAMEAVGEEKGATVAEEGKMMKEQGEKGVVASTSEAEKEKMVEAKGEKAVATSEAEDVKMVEGKGEKAVATTEAEDVKMVEGKGEKAVATTEAEDVKMVEWKGEKAVAATEAEIGTSEPKDVAGGRLITLKSSDGKVHRASVAAAQLSVILSGMIEEVVTDDEVVIVPLVDGPTLVTVLEYCTKHAEVAAAARGTSAVAFATASKALEAWDRDFLDRLTMDALHDLFVASNFLEIQGLLNAIAQKAADVIKGKTTEQIRDAFNIVNDLTPEQEATAAELRRKYTWDYHPEA
jgi:S-phase kinase-associated protein 1